MAVHLRVLNNARAKVEGVFNVSRLDKALRFRPDGYKFVPSFRKHRWDGYVHLLAKPTYTFPLGLLQHVKEHFEERKVKLKVIDERARPIEPHEVTKLANGLKLRPYQRETVVKALAAARAVVKSATGSGKTEMIAACILGLTKKGVPPKTLVVVPNRNLLKETRLRLEEELGFEVGTIGNGKWDEARVSVAIPKTLAGPKRGRGRRKKDKYTKDRRLLLAKTQLLILDECHHAPSSEWFNAVNRANAYYRIGFSGTPLDRHDGASLRLVGMTGPLVANIESAALVKQGYLAKPYVEFIEVKAPELPDTLSYEEAYDLGIVRNKQFHKIVATRTAELVSEGHKVLVLVNRIAHGKNLLAEMKVPAEFVHAKCSAQAIDDAKERFGIGKLPVLIASPIFGEGANIPTIDALVVADGGKSVIRTVQKAGRAMRPKKGKANVCRIVDFAMYTHVYLLEHSLERLQVYKREKFHIE